MDWKSTYTFDSKAMEGVRVTIRRLNRIQRARLQAEESEKRQAFQMKAARLEELARLGTDDRPGAEFEFDQLLPEQAEEYRRLDMELGQISIGALRPVLIRRVFLRAEGFTIDGAPATAETLIESGPDGLLEEIAAAALQESLGLTEDDRKNSSSPGISPVPEPGQATTIAPPAAA